jgi:Cu(I)/Ag(I) efflux system membrane fusion protein
MYIKETGQTVKKGQPLYTLYSETLLTLQKEYLLAKEQYEAVGTSEKRYRSLLEAAERKLMLYGLTKKQIDQLGYRKLPQTAITFVSPSAGVITQIAASEGQYVAEGTPLYRVEDIGKLWVEAELYPTETRLVKNGDQIDISINGLTGTRTAHVDFLSPEYKANTVVTIMRASIDNPDLRLKPGQPVQIHVNHSAREALSVPADAVIRDGSGAHVYIQRGKNTFSPRVVRTGLENFKAVEISEGLNEGDTVAVSGAYLLYSETVLKKGTDPMSQHTHVDDVMQD